MVVSMQGSTVLGAGATESNALSGQRYERSPFAGAWGSLYVCCSAIDDATCELNVGGTSITPPVEVGGQNRMPLVPDDILIGGWPVLTNQLIQLSFVDVGGAGCTVYWRVDLTEAPVQTAG